MTPRSVSSPKKFLIGAGLFNQVGQYIAEHGDHVFIIADRFFLPRIQTETVAQLAQQGIRSHVEPFGGECTTDEIARLESCCQSRWLRMWCWAWAAARHWM